MGQTYTVELNLNIKSEPELVKRSNEYFRAIDVADKEEFINLNTADEVLRSVFPNLHAWGGARYSADFDASYGWENVMYQWFKAVAPALKEGSTIEVWPDSGKWKCKVTGSGAVEELDEETFIKEAKEVNFDFHAFEEHLPHEMRFKHAQVMPDGTLYWVTYGFFDERDLRKFKDALDKFTSRKRAFVTSRDVSTFDYMSDLRYEVGAEIDLGNNICNYEDYRNATSDNEDDFVTEGAEGKRDPGFEYVIYDYTDEDEGYCPIVAKRSTRIEAEATAATWMGNMYGKPARKKFEDRLLTFEKVPKGKFNIGDDFYGPFDDDWNKVESLHDEEPLGYHFVCYYEDDDSPGDQTGDAETLDDAIKICKGYIDKYNYDNAEIFGPKGDTVSTFYEGKWNTDYGESLNETGNISKLQEGLKKMIRNIYTDNSGNNRWYKLINEYNGIGIYQAQTNSHYPLAGEYALVDGNGQVLDILHNEEEWYCFARIDELIESLNEAEEFEISYEQGVGEKPISGVADLGRTLGKKSGLKRQ